MIIRVLCLPYLSYLLFIHFHFILRMEQQQSLHNSPISSPSSSSSSSTPVEEEEDEENHHFEDPEPEHHHHQLLDEDPHRNLSFVQTATETRGASEDTWSCFIVLLTFWFFAASLTFILGFYGPSELQFGPNCSQLIRVNSFLVHEIKVQELRGPMHNATLYGFNRPPPLEVETTWSEKHKVSLPYKIHKEWVYFLNEGSQMNITYSMSSKNSSPLFLVIAQGKESFLEWVGDPSYPNLTLSWNVIHGSGRIQQKIFKSSYYYVAVGNLKPREVKVKLGFRTQALLYNTSEAYYNCSVTHGGCALKLNFLGESAAVLTSPPQEKSGPSHDWYVKLSYEPRWISYFLGSGIMTAVILLVLRLCDKFQSTSQQRVQHQAGEGSSERTPLLGQKYDDASSLGSSFGSVSHDEDEVEVNFPVGYLETNALQEDNNHSRRVCVICFDAPRDCFFLPCGHCATCLTCGTRIVEESGACPICRRKMKKIRKIFTV